ncbi:MAG: glycosyltransferase family 2 protein [Flavipsychrobacter sp.]|jgi:GT2 family glycosyltransferase|nr:glycosyltransferase family 2 protein [Flavipsychrobacter sp.]
MNTVSVITVNFNHNKVTEALLDSIQNVNKYRDIEVIVVDNGSSVNPVPQWETKYPWVKFIRSEQNLGFAGGNNLGIKASKGKYLFFINNDTEVTPQLIKELANTLDTHHEVGIVSPKIKYYDKPDVLQYAGFSNMNYYTARTVCRGQGEVDNGQYDHVTGETGFIHGAAMMLRREAMDKAGLMAENYFLYYEEMDWCEKIRKAGYKIWVNMQAVIYHKESMSVGSTSALKEYFMNRNRILFIRRNCDLATRAVFWPYFLLVVTPKNILGYVTQKQWKFISVLFKAIGWNLTNKTDSVHLGFPVK